jgi:hypothetical protein
VKPPVLPALVASCGLHLQQQTVSLLSIIRFIFTFPKRDPIDQGADYSSRTVSIRVVSARSLGGLASLSFWANVTISLAFLSPALSAISSSLSAMRLLWSWDSSRSQGSSRAAGRLQQRWCLSWCHRRRNGACTAEPSLTVHVGRDVDNSVESYRLMSSLPYGWLTNTRTRWHPDITRARSTSPTMVQLDPALKTLWMRSCWMQWPMTE